MRVQSVRVLLVDGHPGYLYALERLLAAIPGLAVVASVSDGPEALAAAAACQVGMAIVDIDLPSIDGFQLLRRLKQRSPDLRSLLIAARPHGALVYEAIAEGVTGLVAKSAGVSELQTAAAEVAAGKVFIWPPLQADLATYVQARESRRADALTARERDVLREVAGGFSTREIAERVCLSEPTVKTHLSRAFVKLEVSDRTAAVVEALRRGIIDLGVGDRRRRQRQPRLSSLLPATTEAFESGARPEPGSPLRENPQFLDE